MAYDPEKVEALILRIKQEDREAFGELYDLFSTDIYRFVFMLVREKCEAQDIVSETFVRVWRSILRYEKGNFRAYVFMIARNLAMDALRKRKHAALPVEDENELGDTQSSPIIDAVKTEEEKLLYTTLMTLSPEYREVISLRFMHGMSTKEVGELLGKSEASIKITQHRAMTKLRERLKTYER